MKVATSPGSLHGLDSTSRGQNLAKMSERMRARMNGEVLDPQQVADFLKFSKRKVIRLLEKGELPGKKIGNQWRTLKVELDRFLVTETPQDARPKE